VLLSGVRGLGSRSPLADFVLIYAFKRIDEIKTVTVETKTFSR
jgi:hypothetical protein